MASRSREEFKHLAARVRKAFYAGEPMRKEHRAGRERSSASGNGTIIPARSARPGDAPVELPCPGVNAWWRGLPRKARELATVVLSADVSDEIYAFRQAKCPKCPYARKVRDKLYCGCCGCAIVQIGKARSDLGYKNLKAAWGCPRPGLRPGGGKRPPAGQLRGPLEKGM